jgi:hypothetical protein
MSYTDHPDNLKFNRWYLQGEEVGLNNNNNNNNNIILKYKDLTIEIVNAGTSDMSTMNRNTRIVATRCSLGTWFVSGI